MVFRHAPIPRKGSGNQQQQQSLPSIFKKLVKITLLFNSTFTVLPQRNIPLSSAAALFTSLVLNAANVFIPIDRIKPQFQAWWSADVKKAVNETCKAFVAAKRSGLRLCFPTCLVYYRQSQG